MRILTRYVIFELLTVFMVTLTTMTVFVMLILVGEEAVDKGYGLVGVLRTIPYFIPQSLALTVPGTMLLAGTIVYGRIAASNEVIAVKSLGISPMAMVWPTLIVALAVSVLAVWINDKAVSWGRGGVQAVFLESFEEIVYGRLKTKRALRLGNLEINVRGVSGSTLLQPIIKITSTKGKPVLITADEAEVSVDRVQNAVKVRLLNAEGDLLGGSGTYPGVFEESWPIEMFTGEMSRSQSPSNLALWEIGPAKSETIDRIDQLQQEMTADMGYALMTGRSYEVAEPVWRAREGQLRGSQERLQRLYTEPHRRWSGGLSCLCFVLVGAPVAILLRRGEFWGSFFACFLPILLLYYPMLVVTVDFAKSGMVHPIAVWTGNLVLALVGYWLLKKVIRFDQFNWSGWRMLKLSF